MFLYNKKLKYPKNAGLLMAYDPVKESESFIKTTGLPEKPKYLVLLKVADWPEDIIEKVVTIYKKFGLESPLNQKLVEPYLTAFGGLDADGAYDLSEVNWEKVIDYFTWEAICLGMPDKTEEEAHKDSHAFQDKMFDKWGHIFNHKYVYGDE